MKDTAVELMKADSYLLDVSALRLLPALAQYGGCKRVRILVSASLDEALSVSDESDPAAVVESLVGARGANRHELCSGIADAYSSIKSRGQLVVLHDEDTLLNALDSGDEMRMLEALPYQAPSAPRDARAEGVAAANSATILEHSAATGVPILMKNTSLARSLRGRATVIEIADRVEALIEHKQSLTARLFGPSHPHTVKFFVGAVIAAGGIWVPALGVAGIVFAFVDP